MRAIQAREAGPPRVLEQVDLPLPEPGENQVRVKVSYCALTPLDIFARQGRVTDMEWPFTPGCEFGGIVDKIGPGGDQAWLNKRVISTGSFGGNAEYALTDHRNLTLMPDTLDDKTAIAFLQPTTAAWHLLHTAGQIRAGETVLIHAAAGTIGIMVTQMAKSAGAQVIGLIGGYDKAAFAGRFGADHLIDYRRVDWPHQVLIHTQGRGVDLILDGNQGPNASHNLEIIAPLGRIYYFGATAGSPASDIPVAQLIRKNISVAGFNLSRIGQGIIAVQEPLLTEAIVKGTWQFPLGEIVPLAQAPALHQRFEERQLNGRALLEIASI